jgi:sugar phosphate isomerase/epimerase
MKLGYFLNGYFPPIDFEEFVQWGVPNGYRAIDVPLFQADASTICAKHGLEPTSTTGQAFQPIAAEPGVRQEQITQGKRAVDYAAAEGIPSVQIGHLMLPEAGFEDSVRLFAEGCRPVAEHAESKGVRLVFENWAKDGENLGYCPAHWEAMFDAVGSDALGLCLDPSHLVWLGIDYLRATREFADRVYHAHAKDTEFLPEARYRHGIIGPRRGAVGSGTYRFRIPGFGEIDWPRFISALVEIGYDGALAVEHEDSLWSSRTDRGRALSGLVLAQRCLSPLLA